MELSDLILKMKQKEVVPDVSLKNLGGVIILSDDDVSSIHSELA